MNRSTNKQWSVITVTYNSAEHLRAHWPVDRDDRNFHWIVVDNDSRDETVELASRMADTVIPSGGNYGFSVANNLGLAAVHTPYVVFVNPDVSISGTSWQRTLAETVDATGGLVTPQLLYSDGSEQPNARGIPFLSAKVRNRLRPETDRGHDYARTGLAVPTYCAWAMGAAVAGRTDTVRHLGGWDESYFLYYEDHELGLRAWRNGLSVVLDPRVRWVHSWQRATMQVNTPAWRYELDSMRTFYRDHPELLRSGWSSAARSNRLERKGYGELFGRLWEPVA